MFMSYGKRHSIYLRKGKDQDLINYIDSLLPSYDFATVARSLMRDGIKYRNPSKTPVENTTYPAAPTVISAEQETEIPPIKFDKTEVSKDELISRLDEF